MDGQRPVNANITHKEVEPDEEGGEKEPQELQKFWPEIDGSC